ncbi:MAG: hypothetical protein JNL01_01810 [Bdellovibrionales bacterium]|nr:hypothetical protein [Bdellovibrionales bacterium]
MKIRFGKLLGQWAFTFVFIFASSGPSALGARKPGSAPDSPYFDLERMESDFKSPEIPVAAKAVRKAIAADACKKVDSRGDSRHEICKFQGERGESKMNILSLTGPFTQAAYDQGYLLAKEIETGALSEAINNIRKLDTSLPKGLVGLAHKIFACYEHKIKKSVDPEFRKAVSELYRGYKDRLKDKALYTEADFETATYSIDVGNVFYSLMYQAEAKPAAAVGHLLRDCGLNVTAQALSQLWHKVFKTRKVDPKLACTGAVVAPKISSDGFLYHARNLEQSSMIETWNNNPVTYIASEPGYHKYVAFGTAGLIFPGGISGYNEKGIAVSTHQMDPAKYGINYKKDSAAMGPYVQQMILRKAGTLEEALAIAKSVETYSVWTFLVSDSKTGQAISIEMSKEGAFVGTKSTDYGLAQSNHFVAPENKKQLFHDSYNFYLETVGRFLYTDKVLHAGLEKKMDFDALLSHMASRVDWFSGRPVSFGRSVGRIMTIMASIVSPSQNKAWVTVSDRMPSNMGYYLGFKADFNAMSLTPFEAVRIGDYESPKDQKFALALERYQTAYRAKLAGDAVAARKGLEEAMKLSLDGGRDDANFRLMLAHFAVLEKRYTDAYPMLKALESRLSEFHPLQRALIRQLRIYSLDQLPQDHVDRGADMIVRDLWYREAKSVYDYALREKDDSKLFPTFAHGLKAALANVEHLKKGLERIYEKHKKAKVPSIDMKTGE